MRLEYKVVIQKGGWLLIGFVRYSEAASTTIDRESFFNVKKLSPLELKYIEIELTFLVTYFNIQISIPD